MQGRTRTGNHSMDRNGTGRSRQLRNWVILIAAVLVVLLGIHLLRRDPPSTDVSIARLPCVRDQDVRAFGNDVVYYDGTKLKCISGTGTSKWDFPVGSDAEFSVSDTHIVAWNNTQLFILNQSGNAVYNETLSGVIQFARIGIRYCVAVIGSATSPTVLIKNLDGTPVDEEFEAFSNMIVLDAGFYGEADQYMWTLSMDIFSTAANTVLNTFMVGKMNTGEVNLGAFVAYRVLFENSRLRVFTTQQMYTYDYKAVQDMGGTILVYGWQLIDSYVPPRGDAYMLLARTAQMMGNENISELRVLNGANDRRFTLPSACVGAAIRGRTIYGFAKDAVYCADVDQQRFRSYEVSLPGSNSIDEFRTLTADGRAVVSDREKNMYSITLPAN